MTIARSATVGGYGELVRFVKSEIGPGMDAKVFYRGRFFRMPVRPKVMVSLKKEGLPRKVFVNVSVFYDGAM